MGRCRSCIDRPNAYRQRVLILCAVLVSVPPLPAQVVEINPTISSLAAPLPADDTPTGNGLITSQFGENKGPFEYALHLSVRGASDDNIGLTHLNRLDDWFVQIQPSLMLGVGEVAKQGTFILVNYLPSFYRYDEHSEFDSDQHVARVLAGIKAPNLILRVSQDIAILNNIVLAASSSERLSLVPSGRTDLDIYGTDLSANYNMTPHDFIFAELTILRTKYAEPLVSSEVDTASLYLNHGFSQILVLGLGVEGGYDAVDFPTPDQTFARATAHLNFTPSKEFSVDVIAGEEFRDFENIARGTYSTPVFSISSAWSPSESTRVTLSARRQIDNSAALNAQDYVDTSVSGMIRERVCKQLYLAVLGGSEHIEYFNTISLPIPLPTLRSDYYYIQPSADILLTRFWSLGGYYLRRQNSGSISTVDFYSNEFGFRTVLKF
jgi:Putative beta-barrel porin 2